MNRTRSVMSLVLIALLAALGCGESEQQKQDKKAFWTAFDALDPIRAKLAAVRAALPDQGTQQVTPCAPEISTARLATISYAHLQYLLEEPTDAEDWERMQFTDEGFQRMWNKKDATAKLGSSALRSEVAGLNLAAEQLAPLEMLAVFRPTHVQPGELGDRNEHGDRMIARGARWEGWVFVYRLGQAAALGAFPVDGANGSTVSRVLKQGQAMTEKDLLRDAMLNAYESGRSRLARAGCTAA